MASLWMRLETSQNVFTLEHQPNEITAVITWNKQKYRITLNELKELWILISNIVTLPKRAYINKEDSKMVSLQVDYISDDQRLRTWSNQHVMIEGVEKDRQTFYQTLYAIEDWMKQKSQTQSKVSLIIPRKQWNDLLQPQKLSKP